MRLFLAILFVMITLALIAVTSISPRRTKLSMYELERRRRKGDTAAADELRRILLLDDIVSLRKATEALLLVLAVLSAVSAFGFFIGVAISVMTSLVYSRIAHFDWLVQMVDGYYRRIEPRLLTFVERHPRLGQVLRSVNVQNEPNILSSREELEHLIRESSGILSLEEKKLIKFLRVFSALSLDKIISSKRSIQSVNSFLPGYLLCSHSIL